MNRPRPARSRTAAIVGLLLVGVPAATGQPAGGVPSIQVGVLEGGAYQIVTLPLEVYVARVLGGEASPRAAQPSVEALAIAVRTYGLANRGRHLDEGFDLCDQTHCQVMRVGTAAAERAAAATAGRVLLDGGRPAPVFYSASCGGRTEVPSAVWPGSADPAFLPSRVDEACEGEPAWTVELDAGDLGRALAAAGFRGRLRNMRVVSRSGSGRVDQLALEGLTPSRISGQELRAALGRTLGWQRIPSTAFELRRAGRAYRFTGRGSGHGVGLCVVGSMRLAALGSTADDILGRYFPGLTIGVLGAPPPPAPGPTGSSSAASPSAAPTHPFIDVSMPPATAGERLEVEEMVARARDELASALEQPVPPRVRFTFHPGAAEYERATGRPWFTSAAIVDGEIHLLPADLLRDRGVLEPTVRRALVQLLAGDVLADRPWWVRVGIALYYADPPSDDRRSGRRVACPSDGELLQPPSAGALNDAYARARACVARQIASGRDWREVR
jgi:SpoIID/LytB domain protein